MPIGSSVGTLPSYSLAGAALLALTLGGCHSSSTPPSPIVHPTFTFESGPVRPVVLSPDGTRLFVANTSNGSLDIFSISASGLSLTGSVYVGIDPVAVAARSNTEVWVVN